MNCARQLAYLFIGCLGFITQAASQFPGYYVQHFNSENGGVPNLIKSVEQDAHGFTWFSTESGLVRYDGKTFTIFDQSEKGEQISRLYFVVIGANGRPYINTENQGWFYLTDANRLRSTQPGFALQKGQNIQFPDQSFIRKFEMLKHKNASKELPAWMVPDMRGRKENIPNRFVRLPDRFFYFNRNKELVMADSALRSFHKIQLLKEGTTVNMPLNFDTVAIALLQKNGLIYLRWQEMIYTLNFIPGQNAANLLPVLPVGNIPKIVDFLPVRTSSVAIVATVADGIYVFKKQDFTTLSGPNDENNIFYAQAPNKWDGTFTSKGIISPAGIIPLPFRIDPRKSLYAQDGSYYIRRFIGSGEIISQLDSNLNIIREIELSGRPLTGNFFQQKDGSICVQSKNDFGKIQKNSIRWQPLPANFPRGVVIGCYLETKPDQFLAGSREGLMWIDMNHQTLKEFPALKNKRVRDLYNDGEGTTWIATYGNGIYAWHQNRLIQLPLDKNHYLAYVHTFMPDHQGRLWVSTNHGLFCYNYQDLKEFVLNQQQAPFPYYFGYESGFLTNEFNGGCNPAGIVLGNGKFSLPSIKGLVQFYPDSIRPDFPAAAIYVDRIVADTSDLAVDQAPLIIPKGIEHLKFYVSSPFYGHPYNQQIEYSTDTSRQKWQPLHQDQVIELSNLSAGKYYLQLRKKSGFGNTVNSQLITFRVAPFFYETFLFKAALLLLALGLIYLLYRLRIRLLLRQKLQLEEQVAEKTREQTRLIEDLETVVAELEQSQENLHQSMLFKETLTMIITHDLQSPLRFLSDAMKRLHAMQKDQPAELQEMSYELKNASYNMHQLVNDFSIWIKKMNSTGAQETKPVHLYPLLQELEVFFSEIQKARNNQFLIEASEQLHIFSDYQLLKIILRNIIDNANKHTQNGIVKICVCVQDETVTIKITDTGTGMKPVQLMRLKEYASQHSLIRYGSEKDNVGFGYRFITEFCSMLGISFQMDSVLSQGTTVTLSQITICRLDTISEDSPKTLLHA